MNKLDQEIRKLIEIENFNENAIQDLKAKYPGFDGVFDKVMDQIENEQNEELKQLVLTYKLKEELKPLLGNGYPGDEIFEDFEEKYREIKNFGEIYDNLVFSIEENIGEEKRALLEKSRKAISDLTGEEICLLAGVKLWQTFRVQETARVHDGILYIYHNGSNIIQFGLNCSKRYSQFDGGCDTLCLLEDWLSEY